MENQYLHEVAITAIIVKNNKYLITKRSMSKKRFPGMWTVPGGKMETNDYLKLPKDTKDYWYNVLERTLRREVKEEVGIDIDPKFSFRKKNRKNLPGLIWKKPNSMIYWTAFMKNWLWPKTREKGRNRNGEGYDFKRLSKTL